ncbi:MAG: VWA domain-containing protein [Anaerolineales bacterium]|nr:VWA domain-containing protein [Anaerolineales bacterium]
MSRLRLASIIALVCLLLPAAVSADGIIIEPPLPCPVEGPCPPPDPRPLFPLAVQYHHVTVTIENQVAVTRVDQLFRNDNDFTVEGTYLFPLPAEALVSEFAMWVDGQRQEAKILTAEEARQIYDDIVRQLRDPALLEYAGRGAVQTSIFPIEAGDTRRVALEYTQVLPADNGLIHYRYPLNTEKFSTEPLEQVSISVNVVSNEAVRAIYSPSHPVAIARDGELRFSAGYEANDVTPDTDFDLYYSVSPEAIGLNTLSVHDPSSGEGYFVLLAAPSLAADAAQVVAKDVVVVLDQSGSMEGEKFAQAQAAVDYILGHLNAEDRFNLVAFSTGVSPFASRLQPASAAGAARDWARGLRAEGGTNINLALLEAVAGLDAPSSDGAGRPAILIFLTDGLATEGVVDSGQIIANLGSAAPASVRLFAFGVGDDVDTFLLDSLVEAHHGASSYLRPGDRIDETVSGFYAKVSVPVLADLRLEVDGVTLEDIYPNPLPDLFAGGQLVVTGRYRGAGAATVRLSGAVNGQPRTFTYPGQAFAAAGDPAGAAGVFIPRLWATRRVGHLLNQIRLHGEDQELIDSVVTLSIRFGIVTPYTSYLVTEAEFDVLTEAGREALAADEYTAAAATQAPSYGAEAVEKAAGQSALAAAEAPAPMAASAADLVRIVGSRTYLFRDEAWIDTAFDPSRQQAVPVTFASDAYFDLLAARPELAGAFALGPRVIALAADGIAYAVSADPVADPDVPPTYTPAPASTLVPASTQVAVVGATVPPANARPNSGGLCAGTLLLPALVALPLALRKRRAMGGA